MYVFIQLLTKTRLHNLIYFFSLLIIPLSLSLFLFLKKYGSKIEKKIQEADELAQAFDEFLSGLTHNFRCMEDIKIRLKLSNGETI